MIGQLALPIMYAATLVASHPTQPGWSREAATPNLQQQQKGIQLFGATLQSSVGKPTPVQPSSSGTPPKREGIKLFGAEVHPSKPLPAESDAGFKLFGVTIPRQPVERQAQQAPLDQDAVADGGESSLSDTVIWRKKNWLEKNVPRSRRGPYYELIDRLGVRKNYSVKDRLLRSLTKEEREAVENRDEAGIKQVIQSRYHLVRYLPSEFSAVLQPDERRKEKLRIRLAKRKGTLPPMPGRHLKKGWYRDHTPEQAHAIREKVRQLHGLEVFDVTLNAKIARMPAEERIRALENDPQALFKLSPRGKGRPSNERKRKFEVARRTDGPSTAGAKQLDKADKASTLVPRKHRKVV